jgi:hypothetical protein
MKMEKYLLSIMLLSSMMFSSCEPWTCECRYKDYSFEEEYAPTEKKRKTSKKCQELEDATNLQYNDSISFDCNLK